MALSLKPSHLKRYKDIAVLLVRHGHGDLVRRMDPEWEVLAEDDEARASGDPERLASDLEALGPTFIKLGQMLSTRSDLLPPPYLDALSRLQDDVAPFPYAEVETIVQEELGVRLSKAFQVFEAEPMAAASLGQVHRAVLRDGRRVAVKIQRPGIRKQIAEDLDALAQIAEFADAHTEAGHRFAFAQVLEEFRKTLLRELDYRLEASNLKTLGENLRSYDTIFVPQPVTDYTTSRVLTMDFVEGVKVSSLSPLVRTELDGHELARDLVRAYLDQILVDGFFHADPHPGNVFITDDRRIALIDLGMVARIDPQAQEQLLQLLLMISEGRGRDAAEHSIRLGKKLEHFDREGLERSIGELVAQYQNASLAQLQVGRVVMEVSRLQGEFGLRPPPELTMLGKALLNLDEIGRILDEDFDPNDVVREYSASLLQQRMLKTLSPANVFSSMLETAEFTQKLPARLNTLLDDLTEHTFELRIHAFDERQFMANMQKIANRIALGVVLASLIVGAALMMRVETTFMILGYPGIAMLLFLMAAACGFILVFNILHSDRKDKETP